MRVKLYKSEQKVVADFAVRIAAVAKAIGDCRNGGLYDFCVETTAGRLNVATSITASAVLPLVIYTRFEEPERAVKRALPVDGLHFDLFGTSLNPISGKWNWYGRGPDKHERLTQADADQLLRSFAHALKGLLLPEQVERLAGVA